MNTTKTTALSAMIQALSILPDRNGSGGSEPQGPSRDGGATVVDRPPVLDQAAQRNEAPEPPKMYDVWLHNDASTSPYFVIEVLREVFALGNQAAQRIMIAAHTSDKALVQSYPRDLAETRCQQAMAMVARSTDGNVRDRGAPCELTFTCTPKD